MTYAFKSWGFSSVKWNFVGYVQLLQLNWVAAPLDVIHVLFAGSVFIAWLNDTSAYVALCHRNQASLVQKALTHSDTCTVMTYSEHQQLKDGKTVCRCAQSGGRSSCLLCIRKRTSSRQLLPSSPTTTSVRKRQSTQAVQEEPEWQTSAKRKRSLSFGE